MQAEAQDTRASPIA